LSKELRRVGINTKLKIQQREGKKKQRRLRIAMKS